jgi:hypothetical protein
MNFEDLHELLRQELQRRIDLGVLSGVAIARSAGFQQAHISNFLNRKRSLSLGGLDRVMAAQGITVEQVLPLNLSASAGGLCSCGAGTQAIPVVSPSTAMEDAVVRAGSVIETIPVSVSRLEQCRARPSAKFAAWERFVAIRADGQLTAAMAPIIGTDATMVIDRHYNSPAPYRAHQRTLFAVRGGGGLALRFVDFDEGRLILRPLSVDFPVQLVTPGTQETPGDYIVGRVCLVLSEL